MEMNAAATLLLLVLLSGQFSVPIVADENVKTPLQCKVPKESCFAYLYVPVNDLSVDQVADLYGVKADQNVFFPPWTTRFYMILVDCFCHNDSSVSAYVATTKYNVSSSDVQAGHTQENISSKIYNGMMWIRDDLLSVEAGSILEVELLCGCPKPDSAEAASAQEFVTYMVKRDDTFGLIVDNTFNANAALTMEYNNITEPEWKISTGQNLFVPISSKPTQLAKTYKVPFNGQAPSGGGGKLKNFVAGLVAGVCGLLIIGGLVLVVLFRIYSRRRYRDQDDYDNVTSDPSIFAPERSKMCQSFGSVLYRCATFGKHRPSVNNNVKRSITLPREAMNLFDQEKPVVYDYSEIVAATQNFHKAKRLGEGAYGIVYRATLRYQEVAIKQMKATKSSEFVAELKVLCKVHHMNLVELIGYSAGGESLFLVYEFVENGSLSDHLHNPVAQGRTPLTWMARVQVGLDAARGLEYIHEHTQAHYVHRDVKSRNILLDGFFRAKLTDFGLAKLVDQKQEFTEGTAPPTSGTYGYLAPEYVRDGLVTAKSDVFAFGVVVFELLTGCEALPAREPEADTKVPPSPQRQSLISTMLNVLSPEGDEIVRTKRFRSCMDINLDGNYPLEAAYKMARLAKACIEEEPSNRPDMKQIVFTLSQTLLTTIEWEAALAGSSQIFSGLVQGR